MLLVSRELRDEGQVPCLPWGSLCSTVNGVGERLMIGVSSEGSAFEEMPKVLDGTKYCQKLPVKRCIFCLSRLQFPEEESDRSPQSTMPLFDLTTDGCA